MKTSELIHNPAVYVNLYGIKHKYCMMKSQVFYENVYIQTKLNTKNSKEKEHEEYYFLYNFYV
jgi:hypothetical protein